jgi:hypothetical protein
MKTYADSDWRRSRPLSLGGSEFAHPINAPLTEFRAQRAKRCHYDDSTAFIVAGLPSA